MSKNTLLLSITQIIVILCGTAPAEQRAEEAGRNGAAAQKALVHCRRALEAYVQRMDPVTGLLPTNLKNPAWRVDDAAADLYPFLVMAAFFTDRAVYENQMYAILRNEVRYSTRVGRLADDVQAGGRGFVHESADMDRLIFGSSEYAKDGLLPLTELLGQHAWYRRMLGLADDVIAVAPHQTRFGPIPTLSAEVNGELLQVLSRLAFLTREPRYIEQGLRLADFYFLEVIPQSGGLPAHTWDLAAGKPAVARFRLEDHGNEIVGGLSEFVLFLKHAGHPKYKEYAKPMSAMIHCLLDHGLNEDGVWYREISLPDFKVLDSRHAHCWGYLFNAVYTTYLISGEKRFLEATQRALQAVTDKPAYLDDPGGSGRNLGSNAYSDAIESAIVLLNRFPDPRKFQVLDECVERFLNRQRPDGIIEGWHGDGNYVRTALMYALMKSQGTWLEPWRPDVRLGAVVDGQRPEQELRSGSGPASEKDSPARAANHHPKDAGALIAVIVADAPWRGRLHFDNPRHRDHFHLPVNYTRLNEFPEWYTVEADRLYQVEMNGQTLTRLGGELIRGLEVDCRDRLVITVSALDGPPYGTK